MLKCACFHSFSELRILTTVYSPPQRCCCSRTSDSRPLCRLFIFTQGPYCVHYPLTQLAGSCVFSSTIYYVAVVSLIFWDGSLLISRTVWKSVFFSSSAWFMYVFPYQFMACTYIFLYPAVNVVFLSTLGLYKLLGDFTARSGR